MLWNLLLAQGPLVHLSPYILLPAFSQWFYVTSVKMLRFKKAEDRIKTELCNEKLRGWEYMTLS